MRAAEQHWQRLQKHQDKLEHRNVTDLNRKRRGRLMVISIYLSSTRQTLPLILNIPRGSNLHSGTLCLEKRQTGRYGKPIRLRAKHNFVPEESHHPTKN